MAGLAGAGSPLLHWEVSMLQGFVKDFVQNPSRYFWIGLSIPSAAKGWTWLNGSQLDWNQIQLSPGDSTSTCGLLRVDAITSESCSSELRGICQKEATQL
ncbi:KRBBC protein, partial [Geococcyx californianus]|nr:KRBBC protein [Geococcyx californianus]